MVRSEVATATAGLSWTTACSPNNIILPGAEATERRRGDERALVVMTARGPMYGIKINRDAIGLQYAGVIDALKEN